MSSMTSDGLFRCYQIQYRHRRCGDEAPWCLSDQMVPEEETHARDVLERRRKQDGSWAEFRLVYVRSEVVE